MFKLVFQSLSFAPDFSDFSNGLFPTISIPSHAGFVWCAFPLGNFSLRGYFYNCSFKPLLPKSDFNIDFTLSNSRRFYLSKGDPLGLKHGAILYNEAEVFSLSITNPNGRPMLPFDWLIHSSLILTSCHRILFLCQFSAVEK